MSPILIVVVTVGLVVAGIGVLRFPDVYSRAHAVSKTDTLGVGLVLAAAAIEAGSASVTGKIVFLLGFTLVTNPTGAHVLTRSLYRGGVAPWEREKDDGDSSGDAR